jgi:hypothetical protein
VKITYSKQILIEKDTYSNGEIHQISAEDNVDFNTETEDECFLRLKNFVDKKIDNKCFQVDRSAE